MKKRSLRNLLASALVLCLLLSMIPAAFAAEGESTKVTILQTSDLHGMVNPFDYASNKDNKTSMAHVAAVVAQERKNDPEALLIDTGDTLQANYIQEFRNDVPHPMIAAMNYLEYDAWTLGNHEFNFEFKNLQKSIGEFEGAVLAGNIYKQDGTRFQDAYQIFDVNGVKVAIFGINAPHVPQWEASDPTRYDSMTFTKPMEETGKILAELEGKADLILGSIHYGLEGEYETDGIEAVATKYADQLDGLFIGHAHAKVDEEIAGVPVLEPANNGQFVGKMVFTLNEKDGKWTVDDTATVSELVDCAAIAPDETFLTEFKKLHVDSLALAAKAVGTVGKTFMDPIDLLPGIPRAAIEDNPITDLVNIVQLQESGADVSLAALFDASSNLMEGPYLNRDSVKIYKYDNTLFAVKVTGKQLKAIMEQQAGNFFNQYQSGDVTISFNPDIRLYNYDMFAGVDYEINISKPAGSRIENVMYKGEPLADDQELPLALNNYRYGGLSAAGYFSKADVVYEGGAVRDMVTDYVANLSEPLMPVCDNNWKITGADLADPQKDLIYDMVNKGELTIPTSADGRTPNVASLNGPALRAAGTLPALPGESEVPVTPPTPVEPETPTAPAGTYTVKAGDSLWSIARNTLGDGKAWTAIYDQNKSIIKNPNSIYIGQVLQIPAA